MNIRTILFLLVAAAVALPLSAQERRPVYIVNGERYEGDAFREIPPAEIERMEQLPADEQTIERYGSDASNGVILITLKYDSKAVFTADSLSFDRYVARRIKWDATDPVARVVYRFKVQCDGSVVLTDLLESTDGRLRRKVVKAVEEAPRWSPATRTAGRSRRNTCCACSSPKGAPCRRTGRDPALNAGGRRRPDVSFREIFEKKRAGSGAFQFVVSSGVGSGNACRRTRIGGDSGSFCRPEAGPEFADRRKIVTFADSSGELSNNQF